MAVRFVCRGCRSSWWAPPGNGCPTCGVAAECTPDPVVWTVGTVPGTSVSISAQLLNQHRWREMLRAGIEMFVDVAGGYDYVWRPRPSDIVQAGVTYVRIDGVEDTNVDLPDFAFDAVAEALRPARDQHRRALVFCAAGLKRSPHLVYGVLRYWGHDAKEAWRRIAAARPCTDRYEPYLAAAERWISSMAATEERFANARPSL